MINFITIFLAMLGVAFGHHRPPPFQEWSDHLKKKMVKEYGSERVASYMAGNLSETYKFDQNDFQLIRSHMTNYGRARGRSVAFDGILRIFKNRRDLVPEGIYDETVQEMIDLLMKEDADINRNNETYVENFIVGLEGTYVPRIDALVRKWAKQHRDERIRGICEDYIELVQPEIERVRAREKRLATQKERTRNAEEDRKANQQTESDGKIAPLKWLYLCLGILALAGSYWGIKRYRIA